jgi:8-oxo-dGTP pyrophosphatase MutT (NUDIX family)
MERISTLSNRSRKAQVWIGRWLNGEPQILLFQVLEKRGGGWHPVTGGVDPEETFEEGARRELREETGFDPSLGRWIDLEFRFRFTGRFGPAEERAYGWILAGPGGDPVLDPREHLGFRWVGIEEALKEVSFDAQRDALRRFSCYLQQP